jgi:hypothetical protein
MDGSNDTCPSVLRKPATLLGMNNRYGGSTANAGEFVVSVGLHCYRVTIEDELRHGKNERQRSTIYY